MKGLDPIDAKQCQCDKPTNMNFMTFGKKPTHVRCQEEPTCIAIEVNPDAKDGLRGGMSLCDNCRKVLEIQHPDKVTYQKLIN